MVTNEPPKTKQTQFPALFRCKDGGHIVLFSSETKGMLIQLGEPTSAFPQKITGKADVDWVSCNHEKTWERLKVGESVTLYQV